MSEALSTQLSISSLTSNFLLPLTLEYLQPARFLDLCGLLCNFLALLDLGCLLLEMINDITTVELLHTLSLWQGALYADLIAHNHVVINLGFGKLGHRCLSHRVLISHWFRVVFNRPYVWLLLVNVCNRDLTILLRLLLCDDLLITCLQLLLLQLRNTSPP